MHINVWSQRLVYTMDLRDHELVHLVQMRGSYACFLSVHSSLVLSVPDKTTYHQRLVILILLPALLATV